LSHEIRIVWDHTRTEHGICLACWLGFSMQGVYRLESPRLSDMSNRSSRGSLHVAK
jgi:hypothetical protein